MLFLLYALTQAPALLQMFMQVPFSFDYNALIS